MIIVRVTNQTTGKIKTYNYRYANKSVIMNMCLRDSKSNNNTYVITEDSNPKKHLIYKGKETIKE